MQNVIRFTDPPPELARIFRVAFPSYKGRTYSLRTADGPVSVRSYWDGGSRTTYRFVRSDGQVIAAPSSHPIFENHILGVDSVTIPHGVVLVEHSIFCGKDTGLTAVIPSDRIAGYLPPVEKLTEPEGLVLAYTSALKNTYGGEKNIRFSHANREHGITAEEWSTAQTALIGRKLLRKNGSITPEGRNAVPKNLNNVS